MKAVIQRVSEASVTVDGETVGAVGRGFLVLLGVMDGDTEADADIMAAKTAKLRIFTDENDKMNLSVLDVEGEILCVSQFTLCADVKKGNRPSFVHAGLPDMAEPLFDYIVDKCRGLGMPVQTGVFGADMQVALLNDGPVTIIMDSHLKEDF